jgi:hypothetical protein
MNQIHLFRLIHCKRKVGDRGELIPHKMYDDLEKFHFGIRDDLRKGKGVVSKLGFSNIRDRVNG